MDNHRSADENPFRVSKLESLPWIANQFSKDEIFNLWQSGNFKGQIHGGHGTGKTSLALKLHDMALDEGLKCIYLFANLDSKKADFKKWQNRIKNSDSNTIFILDGFDHGSFLQRRSWLNQVNKYLVISHTPIKTLDILAELKPDLKLFEKLVHILAGNEAEILIEKAGDYEALLKKHKDNLRDCFFELYDIWANL